MEQIAKKENVKDLKIKELLDTGKAKGVLSYKEIMNSLEELDLDQEQVEKLYENIEEMNINILAQLLEAMRELCLEKLM